jgi:cellulose synthase/poly-beta-1,6-N-acetylglucosamine synthase-like glycosyltransferase
METWQTLCLVLYCSIVCLLSVYGFHRYHMMRLFFKHSGPSEPPQSRFDELPGITVQLPIFNEFHVIDRLLEAVSKLDYPRDRLHIQVLDDSEDETQQRAKRAVNELRVQGFDIDYLHRDSREGFKAGALAAGLKTAKHDFLFILDADFVPPPQVLLQSVHYFTDELLGMVQMRWGHLNRKYSLLTRIQSIFLDGHLMIEHTARNRSGRFFNFNGTAGIWRRRSIEEAGGWQHDTLTEDLDLSYRAQLAGCKFLFLPDVEIPAELPVEINAFKTQQHRWTKGSVQTAKKILPRVWRAQLPLKIKIEATFHLTANSCYLLMLVMALLMLPVLTIRAQLGWERVVLIDLPLFSMATMAVSSFYMVSQRALYPDWRRQIKYLPALMAIGISLCVSNARGVFEGLVGYQSDFKRTPKYGATKKGAEFGSKYAGKKTLVAAAEIGMACYFALVLHQAWSIGLYLGIPFLMLFHVGFLYTGLMSGVQPWVVRLRHPQPLAVVGN